MSSNSFPLTFDVAFGSQVATAPSESVSASESGISTNPDAGAFPLTFDAALGNGGTTAKVGSEALTITEPTITADAPASVPVPPESISVSEPGASATTLPTTAAIPAASVALTESPVGAGGSATTAVANADALALSESPAEAYLPRVASRRAVTADLDVGRLVTADLDLEDP